MLLFLCKVPPLCRHELPECGTYLIPNVHVDRGGRMVV